MIAPIAVRARPLSAAISPPRFSRPSLGSLAFYIPAAFLLRLTMLGKPAFQADEQFYLLVGQRMAQGAVPFVDIWDRKPWGLFAIFRGAYALPFDPVLSYQVLGLAFSVLTALAIEHIARAIAPRRAARMAGFLYLLWQPVFNVALGQSPVFYNLPVALAALLVVEARAKPGDTSLPQRGLQAMLLLGLAMQIKYTALFEGMGFGLMLLARGRADGWPLGRLAATGGAWLCAALAPTAAVMLGYVLAGHGEAFVQANFLSILGRSMDLGGALVRLAKEALALTPFALALFVAPERLGPSRGERPAVLPDLRLWALVAGGGFLLFGTWYDHYLGPLLVPLCVLAAPVLARPVPRERWYGRLLLGVGLIGAVAVPAAQVIERGTAAQFAAASRAVASELHGRCLYVYEGDSALYRTTNACIPTRFAFPSHLNALNEAGALGIDPVVEVRRILASRPGVVVIAESRRPSRANRETGAIIRKTLEQSYRKYAVVALGTRRFGLWKLEPR
jgi:predicted outer membrane lipoprotein